MSSLGSPNPFFIAGKKAYEIERSLRFNNDDDTHLIRTIGSTSNRRTYTYSFWIKRTMKAAEQYVLYNGHLTGTPYVDARFEANSHQFQFIDYDGSHQMRIQTNRTFRDPGAWYHFVIAIDTTQSTESNRAKFYVNGVQETSFSIANYPSQNQDTAANVSGHVQTMGAIKASGSNDLDGYLAEINFIDGFQYDPSYFAETDAITGQWIPKKYTGSYGTNGFYLNFSTNTLGTDRSGNGNDFTPNNFSVVAGVGNDAVSDSPTNNFATLNPLFMNGNETAGTFSEGNLKLVTTGYEYGTALATFSIRYGKYYWEVKQLGGSIGIHGIVRGSNPHRDVYVSYDPDGNLFGFGYQNNGSIKGTAGTGTTTNANLATGLATYTTNDIIGFASDISNGTLAIYKNNTLIYTITGINDDDWIPAISGYTSDGSYSINFGQQAFSYTPPTGYKKLNSPNLPDPTILDPTKHFGTITYGGNGSTQVITDTNAVDFTPDWVWTKRRDGSNSHLLFDSLRGVTNWLTSSQGTAEGTNAVFLTAFNNGGFTSGNNGDMNGSGRTYVAWNWNAGDTDGKTYTVKVVSDSGNKYRFDDFGTSAVTLDLAEGGTYIFDQSDSSNAGHPLRFSTTSNGTHGGGTEYTTGVTTAGTPGQSGAYTQIVVAASAPTLYYYCTQHSGMGGQVNTNSTLGSSNFDGAIQSVVKANTTAGFSIVLYSGSGSNATVGHGLGVAPSFYVCKTRNGANYAEDWVVYHKSLGATKNVRLQSTAVSDTQSVMFNDTEPTSSVFSLGTNNNVNGSGGTFVAYCFSEVAGYSKFGSYVGNGSADGTFVFTGFRPAWVLIKCSSNAENWYIIDNKRPEYNGALGSSGIMKWLRASTNDSESQNGLYNFLSNGFKLGYPGADTNASGRTYIYLAFAESPFKNARAR